MYSHNCYIPSNQMYRNNNNNTISYSESYPYNENDERFFLAPFLVGGLAGTALGYGIANNNQMNGGCCHGYYPMYQPVYSYPYPITTSNNYYY